LRENFFEPKKEGRGERKEGGGGRGEGVPRRSMATLPRR